MDYTDKRKHEHLELAKLSQTSINQIDKRFYYEPLFGVHPQKNKISTTLSKTFLGKTINHPLWISSMTGGTGKARHINQNLAKAAKEFGLGLGLGSCRVLLESDEFFEDFNLRPLCGVDIPFYANFGIVQIDEILKLDKIPVLMELLKRLEVDGLIIHVNPLQEWLQPEGDRLIRPSIDIIKQFLDQFNLNVIVKEVGQGMGPASIKALLELPIAALDFGAFGGTNFSYLEALRSERKLNNPFISLANVGHPAEEMISLVKKILADKNNTIMCRELILSGGVKDFLDGYYLLEKSPLNTVYAQARPILQNATGDYSTLEEYLQKQIEGLLIANQFLKVK